MYQGLHRFGCENAAIGLNNGVTVRRASTAVVNDVWLPIHQCAYSVCTVGAPQLECPQENE